MFPVESAKQEISKLQDFYGTFNQYRLVDPITHDIYKFQENNVVKTDLPPCYKIWHRNRPCANCVSLRACSQKKQYIKMEYLDEQVLMILSRPVDLDGRSLALELAADVTDSMMVSDSISRDFTEITSFITRLNEIAVEDTFTKLYNNQYMKDKLEYLCKTDPVENICLLIIDLDHFKKINDSYGHMTGDKVIQGVAQAMHQLCQVPGCYCGRMGGDEFCVIFQGYTLPEARPLCDALIEKLNNCEYHKEDKSFFATVSAGVGQRLEGEAYDSFIDRVDQLMYECKRSKGSGR